LGVALYFVSIFGFFLENENTEVVANSEFLGGNNSLQIDPI